MVNSPTRKNKSDRDQTRQVSIHKTKSNRDETTQAPSIELHQEDINKLPIAHEVIAGCVVQWDYFADGGLHEAFFGSQLPTAAHDCELRTLYAVPNHFVVRWFRRVGRPDIDNLLIVHVELADVELVDVEARGRFSKPKHVWVVLLFLYLVLSLPGPEVIDPNCGIATLGNALILEDFAKVTQGKNNRIKHANEWFQLFDLNKSKCNERALKRSWRKLFIKFHPDKFDGDKSCAQRMSLIINAGKEVLENHPACQGGRHKRGDL